MYIPLLDGIIGDLRSRFNDNVLTSVSSLSHINIIPSNAIHMSSEEIGNIICDVRQYSDCLTIQLKDLELHAELDLWTVIWSRKSHEDTPNTVAASLHACDKCTFSTIHTLLTILLSMPVSIAGLKELFQLSAE